MRRYLWSSDPVDPSRDPIAAKVDHSVTADDLRRAVERIRDRVARSPGRLRDFATARRGGAVKFADLKPHFRKLLPDGRARIVHTLAEADGVWFLSPAPVEPGQVPVGILCWFQGHAPEDLPPLPGRWIAFGTDINDLTLSPSVLAGGWHGHIQNGEVTTC